MIEFTALAVGRPRARLDAMALAVANVDLDGLQVADLEAAVDQFAVDPRRRRDRPGVEPAK